MMFDIGATTAADDALTISLAAYARAAGAATYADAFQHAHAARQAFPNLGNDVTSGALVLAFLDEHVAGAIASARIVREALTRTETRP